MPKIAGTISAGQTTALFARASRNSDTAIVPINASALNRDGPKPNFYCVHSVSGAAGTDFLELAEYLDPDVRFFGIQAPPRQMQNDSFGGSIETIARHYVDALLKHQPNGRMVIGGYCVGAVIGLEIVKQLRLKGREVGPLIAIDGVPENTGVPTDPWGPAYWLDWIGRLPDWFAHADLMRNKSLKSTLASIRNNTASLGKRLLGLRRFETMWGGYALDGQMELLSYPPEQRAFINRLFAALFAYRPESFDGRVIVYEAKTIPLFYRPQIGIRWRSLSPQSEVTTVVGTHIGIMHSPYVQSLANDVRKQVLEYFQTSCTVT